MIFALIIGLVLGYYAAKKGIFDNIRFQAPIVNTEKSEKAKKVEMPQAKTEVEKTQPATTATENATETTSAEKTETQAVSQAEKTDSEPKSEQKQESK